MPCPQTQCALQRIVVGIADAIELVDAAVVRELRIVLAELIDVEHDRELAALAAHVADLPDCHPVTEALLDIQVVIEEIGCSEVLADPEHVENRLSTFGGLAGDTCRNTWENIRVRLPGETAHALHVASRRTPRRARYEAS